MGVTGLWKLLEPCGKPVPLESLEGKVIAVDISIWLNQAMKGYRDGQNGTVQNAHLMGVFHRVCKLLTYKIKPVFVFDGGVPALKRDTLAQRRLRKSSATSAADRSSQRLVQNLLQQEALRAVLGERAPLPLSVGGGDGTAATDPFQLPPAPPPTGANDSAGTESESSDSEAEGILSRLGQDLHSFDFDSEEFRNLEPQVKHDILSELKDTRKQSSWGKLDQMPKKADNFSDFQMKRLLKRKKFQASMDEVEAEITKRNTELLHMGIDLPGTITSRQMASRSGTYLLLGHLKSEEEPAAAEPEPEEEVDEAGLVDAANTAEYLAGADLFGGKGTAGASSSAAKVDQDMDAVAAWRNTLKDEGKPSETAAVAAETRTVEAFSEMGKKYSNLYLKFSAQWLEDEKSKSPQKPKSKVSPPKREEPPKRTVRSAGGRPNAAKKVRFDEVSTFSDLTKGEGKLTSKLGKSKPRTPVTEETELPITSVSDALASAVPRRKLPKKGRDSSTSKTSALGSTLEITIDPLARPVGEDDMFKDIFSCMGSSKRDSVDSAVVLGTEPAEGGLSDAVAEMSDSGDSSSEGESVRSGQCERNTREKGKAMLKTGCGPEGNNLEPKIKVMDSNVGKEVSKILDASVSLIKDNDVSSETSGEPSQAARARSEGKKQSVISPDPCSSTGHVLSQRDGASSDGDQGRAHSEPTITRDATDQTSPSHVSSSSKAGEHVHSQPCRSVASASDEDADDPCLPHPTPPAPLLPVSPSRHSVAVPPSPPPEPDPVWEELGVEPGPEPADLREQPEPPDHKEADVWEEVDPADLMEEPETAAVWEEVEDAELEEAARQLAERQMALLEQRGRQLRAAATVTDQMYSDVQALLELFGVPYVVSPQEAEAQCAFLEIAGLTHGTITDDSDIWLFGGQRVYKNFFNQNKFVELYQAGDIRGSLGLERGQLVCVALLTGSDYTLGVESVGCVRALEILAEFPGGGLAGLRQFRAWWELCREGRAAARTPIRRSLQSLSLPLGFPSEAVLKAYLEPEVDTSREPFSWAPPDVDGLRLLAAAKLGWGGTHTDSILQPMLKRRQQAQGQQRLDRFFQPEYASEVPVEASQRLQRAVRRVRGESESPPAGTAPRSAAGRETESVETLMDDGMDDILASLQVPGERQDGDAGGNDVEMSLSDAVDELGEMSGDELDKPGGAPAVTTATDAPATADRELPPKQPSGAGRPRRAGVVSGSNPRKARASASKPRTPRAKKSVDTEPVNPLQKRRRAVPDTAYSSGASGSSVPADLSDLAPKDREHVLLVRRLRQRVSQVRTEMRLEDPARPAPPPARPSTKLVRKRMLAKLLKENPRLKMEREDQLRRKMGLPPLIRAMSAGRSCRNPAAARSRATFEEAIVGEAGSLVRAAEACGEAAAPTGSHGGAPPLESTSAAGLTGAAGGPDPQPQTASASAPAGSEVAAAGTSPPRNCSPRAESATATAGGVSLPPAVAAPPAGTGAAGQPAPSPSQSRLHAWMRDAAVPLPPPPAVTEAVPQRVQSQRRNAEAKLQAAQLLKARRLQGGGQGKKRRGSAPRRRAAPSPGAARLSESSDSE